MAWSTTNQPFLKLTISTEATLENAAQRARTKAAAFLEVRPERVELKLRSAERDVDLESTSSLCEVGTFVETRESYHCEFIATVES